jgi:P27 family predicted phage terminase small subunit
MAGRPPKPTALKIAAGNPGKRKLAPDAEPKFPAGAPKCPPLSKGAKAVWKRVAPFLESQGLLTHADRDSLAAYCIAVAMMEQAEAALANEGWTILVGAKMVDGEPVGGQVVPHPALKRLDLAMTQVRQFGNLFGLNASARSRVHGTPQAEAHDEFDDYTRKA